MMKILFKSSRNSARYAFTLFFWTGAFSFAWVWQNKASFSTSHVFPTLTAAAPSCRFKNGKAEHCKWWLSFNIKNTYAELNGWRQFNSLHCDDFMLKTWVFLIIKNKIYCSLIATIFYTNYMFLDDFCLLYHQDDFYSSPVLFLKGNKSYYL